RGDARFKATNQLIELQYGRVESLLESGSGEGVQSQYLSEISQALRGIDVSATAVTRARKLLPTANFQTGELIKQPWVTEQDKFDLVVACEVLYYVADVRKTLEAMNHVGKNCFVSFFTPEALKLSKLIDAIPNVQKSWFSHDGVTW